MIVQCFYIRKEQQNNIGEFYITVVQLLYDCYSEYLKCSDECTVIYYTVQQLYRYKAQCYSCSF